MRCFPGARARMRTFEEGAKIAGTSEDRAHQTIRHHRPRRHRSLRTRRRSIPCELERYTVGDVVANGFFYLAGIGSDLAADGKRGSGPSGARRRQALETRSNSGAHLEQTRARFVEHGQGDRRQQKEMLRTCRFSRRAPRREDPALPLRLRPRHQLAQLHPPLLAPADGRITSASTTAPCAPSSTEAQSAR